MKDAVADQINKRYYKAVKEKLIPHSEATRRAMKQIVNQPRYSASIKDVARHTLELIASGYETHDFESDEPFYKLVASMSNEDRMSFLNAVGDGPDNRLNRRAQRQALKSIRKK